MSGLPSAADQTPFPATTFAAFTDSAHSTEPDSDHDSVRFEGTDFTGSHAEGHVFIECSLVGACLDDVHLEGARWSQCSWESVHGLSVSLPEATLVETVFDGCRLAAVSAWGSSWRDVTVRGGKIDFLNLRGARLRAVAFVDCIITSLDLQETTVDGLTFEGCTLVEPEFGRGRYVGLDLSGAALRAPRGLTGLRGASLSRLQVIDLADQLAAELGIRIAP